MYSEPPTQGFSQMPPLAVVHSAAVKPFLGKMEMFVGALSGLYPQTVSRSIRGNSVSLTFRDKKQSWVSLESMNQSVKNCLNAANT